MQIKFAINVYLASSLKLSKTFHRSESELEQTKHKLVEEQDARRKLEETCRKSEDKIKVLF